MKEWWRLFLSLLRHALEKGEHQRHTASSLHKCWMSREFGSPPRRGGSFVQVYLLHGFLRHVPRDESRAKCLPLSLSAPAVDDWIDVLLRREDILTRAARTAVLRVTADHTKWLCVNAEEYTELWSSLALWALGSIHDVVIHY